MNAASFAKIREIATANIAKLEAVAAEKLEKAKADPLNGNAVRAAVESQGVLEGYRRAISEILIGMVGPSI